MLNLLTKYLLSMVCLQDLYYLMIGCLQQAASSIDHKEILRGEKTGEGIPCSHQNWSVTHVPQDAGAEDHGFSKASL